MVRYQLHRIELFIINDNILYDNENSKTNE